MHSTPLLPSEKANTLRRGSFYSLRNFGKEITSRGYFTYSKIRTTNVSDENKSNTDNNMWVNKNHGWSPNSLWYWSGGIIVPAEMTNLR